MRDEAFAYSGAVAGRGANWQTDAASSAGADSGLTAKQASAVAVLKQLPEEDRHTEAGAEDSSSSENEVDTRPAAATTVRNVRQPGSRVKHWMALVIAGAMQLIFLQFSSGATSTEQEHRVCVEKFRRFAETAGNQLSSASDVEAAMLDYLNDLYKKGVHLHKAEKTISGWMYYHPSYGRLGSASLPRV